MLCNFSNILRENGAILRASHTCRPSDAQDNGRKVVIDVSLVRSYDDVEYEDSCVPREVIVIHFIFFIVLTLTLVKLFAFWLNSIDMKIEN